MQFLRFLFSIKGRVRRREFWLATLILWAFFADWLGSLRDVAARQEVYSRNATNAYLESLVAHGSTHLAIVALLALIAFTIVTKRFHDRGKSGFWMVLGFVPILGWIWMIFELMVLPGTDGSNAYGSHPTYETDEAQSDIFW